MGNKASHQRQQCQLMAMSSPLSFENVSVAVEKGKSAPLTLACTKDDRENAFCLMTGNRYLLVAGCYIPTHGVIDQRTAIEAREMEASLCTHMY